MREYENENWRSTMEYDSTRMRIEGIQRSMRVREWELKEYNGLFSKLTCNKVWESGRAISQAVTIRFPARRPGFDPRSVLRFLIPSSAPYSISSGAGTIGQLVADVPSGLTPHHETKEKSLGKMKLWVTNNPEAGTSFLISGLGV
jgi:hypothetical protein